VKREFRTIHGAQIRAKKKDGKNTIEGYASVFDQLSVDLGWYRERIMPGAFTECLKGSPDVRCLFNHDPSVILGRTKNGTLRLKEDNTGLRFEADPPDTQAARDVVTVIDRGDVDQCSFGMYALDVEWTQEPDPSDSSKLILVRRVNRADCFDTSPVTYPAFEGTSVDVRSIFPDGPPDDVLEHVPDLRFTRRASDRITEDQREAARRAAAKDCACDCAACQDGECDECSDTDCEDSNCTDCPAQEEARSLRGDSKRTKRVDGEDLTADCFAFVGEKDKTATWKLPIKFSTEEKTKSHIRNAIARFGQTKGIPAEEKSKVWKRIVAAAKKHGIDVKEEDSIRAGIVTDDERDKMQRRVEIAKRA
jgi:hypothetical protein